MRLCNQDLSLAFILPLLQLATNLTGQSRDPVTINWDSLRELDIFCESATLFRDSMALITLEYAQLFNAYIMNDKELVRDTFDRLGKLKSNRMVGTHFANYFCNTMDGLVFLSLYKEKREYKHKRGAAKVIAVLTKLSKKLSGNCLGMLLLLQAEKAAITTGSKMEGKANYDKAISQLARTGFTHFTAIAYERAGDFMMRHGDDYWSKHYLSHAMILYTRWGATVKVRQMQKQFPHICQKDNLHCYDEDQGVATIAVRGKKQYNEKMDSFREVASRRYSL